MGKGVSDLGGTGTGLSEESRVTVIGGLAVARSFLRSNDDKDDRRLGVPVVDYADTVAAVTGSRGHAYLLCEWSLSDMQ